MKGPKRISTELPDGYSSFVPNKVWSLYIRLLRSRDTGSCYDVVFPLTPPPSEYPLYDFPITEVLTGDQLKFFFTVDPPESPTLFESKSPRKEQ